ncbi:MAG TPA: hypothetical protein VE890_05965, partial [Thermoguttaceae bacterium]|nr:hypothetical protein [Thermoguttaceae bacterium]
DRLSLQCCLDHLGVDLVLWDRPLGGIDTMTADTGNLRSVVYMTQNRRIYEPIVQDKIGLAETFDAAQGDQARIAGTGPHEKDSSSLAAVLLSHG